jgi:hypothetical protein
VWQLIRGFFSGKQEAPAGPLNGRRFVLDGTNIALLHGRQFPQLRYVLAVADYLALNGGEFHCFFDANTPYLLREFSPPQFEAFEKITREAPWSARYQLVPSGSEADQWILARARKEHADVISNDRFRDRARKNRWIWKRRHGLRIADGCMTLASLEGSFAVLPSVEEYLSKASYPNKDVHPNKKQVTHN